jgi:predicted secreted hydrolase
VTLIMKPIIFPRDEKAHDKIIEWWYWNGHLKGEDGNHYAFMDCLFQADSSKVKLPFLKAPFRQTYFSHSVLSDLKNQQAYPVIDYVSLISRDSFKGELLSVDYIGANILEGFTVSSIEETMPFKYRLRADNFDLILTSTKKPLLEGGRGFLDLGDRSTYYYSLTNLATEGFIKVKNKKIKVKGKSWMDHQWADAPYAKDTWNWFSIQLDNNIELVCFEYVGEDRTTAYAGISYQNGRTEHFKDIRFTPIGDIWKSSKTRASYPLSWRIEIPERKIDLTVKPLIKNQEMIFGTLNYWEGPLSVGGKFGSKKVTGQGFLELVGRPSQYKAMKFFQETFKTAIKDIKKIAWKR